MKAVKAKWLIISSGQVLEDTGFTYDQDRILEIMENSRIDQLSDLTEREEADIVMPGFINAHMHQYGVLSHGFPVYGKVTDFHTFLSNYWWPYMEDRIREKHVKSTTVYSAMELIRSGVTFVCDTLEAPYTEEGTLITQGKILEEMGLRGIVSLESSLRIDEKNGNFCLKQNVEAAEYFRAHSNKIRGIMCTHTTFSCDDDFIKEAVKLAEEHNLMLQFHMSESKYEREQAEKSGRKKPTEIYEAAGALSERTLISQCVKIDSDEIAILRKNKVKTVHMPVSNCEVGGGIAPVPQMLQAGIPVALGTDGYMNDFFLVLKEAFLIHKANMETTEVMSAADVFKMATEYGAECVGLEHGGKLEKGYLPDFIMMKDMFPTPVTKDNIFDQIVVHGRSAMIQAVVVAGKKICENQKILTVDEENAEIQMKQTAAEFFAEAGQKGMENER